MLVSLARCSRSAASRGALRALCTAAAATEGGDTDPEVPGAGVNESATHGRILKRITDPSAPYHPLVTVGDRRTPTRAFVVRRAGTLKDGSHVYEHIKVVGDEGPSVPLRATLTEPEARLAQQLRNQDPARWTQRRLAEHFGVRPSVVGRVAPAPEGVVDKEEARAKAARSKELKELQAKRHQRKLLRRTLKDRYKGN